MPEIAFNIASQIASEITRSGLLTLISSNAVERKQYYITNAVNNTRKIAVFYRAANQTTFGAVDVNTGVYGRYFLTQDLFIPIAEAQGAVLTYINLASFPATGLINTVYIAQDTGTGYTWNGTAYVALSGGTVFAANFGALPATGAANTLYITTDNGSSYLWNGSEYIETSNGNGVAYIPLGGTEEGQPVTGDIEASGNIKFFKQATSAIMLSLFFADEDLYLSYSNSSGNIESTVQLTSGAVQIRSVAGSEQTDVNVSTNEVLISSNNPEFEGAKYSADYSANYTDRSLVDKAWVESRPKTLYQLSNTNGDTVGVGTTYYALTNPITDSTTQNARFTLMTHDGIIHRQMILFTSNQPSTLNSVYTIQKNGVDTTLTLNVPANTVAGSYSFTGNAVSFEQGDRIGIKVVSTGSGTSGIIGAMSTLIENTETF